MIMMESKEKIPDAAIACSLDSLELVKRKAELQQEVFGKAEEVVELEDSIRFTFKTSNGFSYRLIEFIDLERNCCPFFSFQLDFKPHHGSITLEMGGPKEAKEILKSLM